MQSAFHPDFGAVVNYSFVPLPESSDGQVSETIRMVRDFVRADSKSPEVRALAEQAVLLGNGNPNLGVWQILKRLVRFKRDEAIAMDLQAEDPETQRKLDDTIEVLIRPIDQLWLIRNRGIGVGDCDCFHLTGASMLLSLEIPSSLVTVSAAPSRPQEFSHVYLASYWNNVRFPLDISHGEYPGWECPNMGRIQEWPVMPTVADQFFEFAIPFGLVAAGAMLLRKAYR